MTKTEKIYKCKSCKETVQKDAKKCPHCGEKYPTVSNAKGCLGAIVFIFILSAIMVSCSEDTPPKKVTPTTESSQQTTTKTTEWYEGTSIQNKTLSEWANASYKEKLVTAANVYAYFYNEKKLSPSVSSKLSNMDDLKPYAEWLVRNVDTIVDGPEGQRASNQKVSETMVILLTIEGHLK
ncbi:hypothetical protein MRM63_13570 [bacterium 19MO03SA05]|uniref:Zinc-ribbon domain-containing protein n=1 Tax=bacterium 19MO03SA05 TaxID=2920620 RepID=A0AAU6VIR1_UNCXX